MVSADDDKFLMISLDESDSESSSKTKAIAEVLSSRTCKKIINFLASAPEASQKDISTSLKIPMNTLDYNMKKLLESGFIQKKKNFFWSKKGKKIIMYEVSKKSIVISPGKKTSEKFKSLIPAFLIVGAGTFAAWAYQRIISVRNVVYDNVQKGGEAMLASAPAASNSAPVAISTTSSLSSMLSMPVWGWFLLGGIVALVVVTAVNWKKL